MQKNSMYMDYDYVFRTIYLYYPNSKAAKPDRSSAENQATITGLFKVIRNEDSC